jgi:hypothetical protein
MIVRLKHNKLPFGQLSKKEQMVLLKAGKKNCRYCSVIDHKWITPSFTTDFAIKGVYCLKKSYKRGKK